MLCGVTLHKFLNISELIFPKSLREANTICAFYPFPASSLTSTRSQHAPAWPAYDGRRNNYNLSLEGLCLAHLQGACYPDSRLG